MCVHIYVKTEFYPGIFQGCQQVTCYKVYVSAKPPTELWILTRYYWFTYPPKIHMTSRLCEEYEIWWVNTVEAGWIWGVVVVLGHWLEESWSESWSKTHQHWKGTPLQKYIFFCWLCNSYLNYNGSGCPSFKVYEGTYPNCDMCEFRRTYVLFKCSKRYVIYADNNNIIRKNNSGEMPGTPTYESICGSVEMF